jgi:oxalate decarboxylase/phosphoglucose isomerase-like protein (cupin superfamily)
MTERTSLPQAEYNELTAYERWMEEECLPILKGYHIDSLYTCPLEPWERKGGSGAFINLVGSELTMGSYLCEIPPGGSLKPQKHLFEEMIFIVKGQGATTVWNEGGPKRTFEWQDGSLFAIPLNAWHEHFNGRGDMPARYLGVTNAPSVMNMFHNMDFIFKNDYIFRDRYGAEEDYFSSDGKLFRQQRIMIWESNFIPDVRGIKLYDWRERGHGSSHIHFEMAENTTTAHISEFPVGTYKKAHRHGPGAHVVIIGGDGYDLVWPEGGERMKIGLHDGCMYVPPDRWFHQHFNTGTAPLRYLALRSASRKNRPTAESLPDVSLKLGGWQIEYEDEDPEIRRMFQEELDKKGLEMKMPPASR